MGETYCFESFTITREFWISNLYNKDDPNKTRSYSTMWADMVEEKIDERVEELRVILKKFREDQIKLRNRKTKGR